MESVKRLSDSAVPPMPSVSTLRFAETMAMGISCCSGKTSLEKRRKMALPHLENDAETG